MLLANMFFLYFRKARAKGTDLARFSCSQIEIWERGAGYTMASGSSCAAASAAHKLGLVENKIKVYMLRGEINIEIKEDGHVYMTGSVTGMAAGEFAGLALITGNFYGQ